MWRNPYKLLVQIAANQAASLEQGRKVLDAIDDLKNADVALTSEVALIVPAIAQLQTNVANLTAALAAAQAAGNVDPAIEAEVANVKAATDALAAALPPAAPAPSGGAAT